MISALGGAITLLAYVSPTLGETDMPSITKRSLTYAAFQYPNSNVTAARINVHCEDSYHLFILFKKDGPLPDNTFDNKMGVTYESVDRYSDYIDLLRNESPVWVNFNTERNSFITYASGEPVGENEM